MKYTTILFLVFSLIACKTVKDSSSDKKVYQSHQEEVTVFQQELNRQYADEGDSPLKPVDRAKFQGHDFYPISEKFKVEAKLTLTPESKPFQMPTSTDRLPIYRQFAVAHFEVDGMSYQLSLYQNQSPQYMNYLFVPFRDLTNSAGSYGGGRFLDLDLPKGNTIVIDFNKAYNPYCAYNDKYSCPIPPKENSLELAVEAGVKLDH